MPLKLPQRRDEIVQIQTKVKEAGRLPRIPRSSFPPEQQEWHDQLVGGPDRDPRWPEGNLDGINDILMASPVTAKTMDDFGRWLRRGATSRAVAKIGTQKDLKYEIAIPSKLEEMTLLTVARETNCQKLWHSQYWPARYLGLSEESAAIIRTYGPVEKLKPDEINIVKFVQEMVRTRTVSDETFYAVREQLGEAALVDLMVLIGFWLMRCMIRLTIKENMIERAALEDSPLMEVHPEYELPPLPPELDRGRTKEFYFYQDRGHPEPVLQKSEHVEISSAKPATVVIPAALDQRVDGYFLVGAGSPVNMSVKDPMGRTVRSAQAIRKLRSFAFFAESAGDHSFVFTKQGELAARVDLIVNVLSK